MSGDADEISTSDEAAVAFKTTVNQLMTGLGPIVQRHDKSGWKVPDIGAMLASANSGSGITAIFEKNLSPSQKFFFAQAWAKAMDEHLILGRFIKSTKPNWIAIEAGTEHDQEVALLKIVDGLEVPGNGSQFLRQLYDKKSILTDKEKKAIVEYFKTCIYYAQMYEEFKDEEASKSKKSKKSQR
jgi:hypothetical protein